MSEPIPEDVQRFILTSIDSAPHLEAMLLLRRDAKTEWDAKALSQRLYLSEKRTAQLLTDLCNSGFVAVKKGKSEPFYYYQPVTIGLNVILGRLAEIYSKNLIEVTNLSHSKVSKQAQQWGEKNLKPFGKRDSPSVSSKALAK